MNFWWPTSTTVRHAVSEVQLLYVTVVANLPRFWINSLEKVFKFFFVLCFSCD